MSADVTAWAAAGSANAATIARTPHTRAHAGNDNLFRIMLRNPHFSVRVSAPVYLWPPLVARTCLSNPYRCKTSALPGAATGRPIPALKSFRWRHLDDSVAMPFECKAGCIRQETWHFEDSRAAKLHTDLMQRADGMIDGIDRMALLKLHKTVGVRVGPVQVGGGAPVVVQSMTMTDTADAEGTSRQCIELAQAGSDMVRVTVNVAEAAAAVPEIKRRMLDAGVTAPLIGDFHYNGHLLLTRYPACADALDKYRINPGNVGTGRRRDEQFATICGVARDRKKPVRIGVNGGSLNQELVLAKMQENTDRALGHTSEEIINECMVLSAVQSTELALESGLRKDQIIIS